MNKVKTFAWYFPNWHATPLNDKWHGKGWTEWEVLKQAKPRFEGHIIPRLPLCGFEDESDPKVFEKKIDTALAYGIDGFIFDFYWYRELGQYRMGALNDGFLNASNCEKCEFSINWCNHDPIYVHPASFRNKNIQLADGDFDVQFVHEVTEYCIEHYFCKPNYQRVDGKIYFGIWDMGKFVRNFGGLEGAAAVINDFRERARRKGYELHLATHRVLLPGYNEGDRELANKVLKTVGIDSVFSYNWPDIKPKEWPKVEYADFREAGVKKYYEDVDFFDVPLDINVSTGWDSSARTCQSDKYEESCGYPFSPIVINNTPEEVEIAFKEAKKFIDSGKFNGNMLLLSCWNEWTEGSTFEPDQVYGYGYLEALKNVIGS